MWHKLFFFLMTSFHTNRLGFLIPKNRNGDTALVLWISLQVQLLQIGDSVERILVLVFELPSALVQEPVCGIQGDHVFEAL